MAVFYNEGETKIRPGIYQRHTNIGYDPTAGAMDGYSAIPIQAGWGPLGVVVKNTRKAQLRKNYGAGTYGAGYTVPAAEAMFDGGAAVVYTYRLGTGGTAAKITLKDTASSPADAVTITAKYPGDRTFTCTVRAKLGNDDMKECVIYEGTTEFEKYSFEAGTGVDEAGSLIKAASQSDNFIFEKASGATGASALALVANAAFTAGTNPTVTNDDYSAAFAAFEPYYYNTIAIDVDDDTNMTLSLVLHSYLSNAYKMGKLGIAVVGETVNVDFETRCAHAKAFNDFKCVYQGGGYKTANGSVDGALAICYTAGVIASTPSNKGITHTVLPNATDVLESLTYSQYEEAIENGMLLLSISPEGVVWYDSGINTMTASESQDLDAGWKKIRRVKVRFEMIDRIDRTLSPKVGRVSCDSDGVSDVIQSAQRILDYMVNEGKLMSGASFTEDSDNPHEGDSAWFIIRADDIDSLEKIYLQYQFRYSQNS